MTIGTAKPTKEELQKVRHYFIDEFSITESLTAADFERLALGYLDEIFKEKDVAVVCGGTGLYIKALCEGLDAMPDVDDAIAHEINELYETNGLEWLQQSVQYEDPEYYKQGEIKNPARLIRALIFKRSTGESIVNFRTGDKKNRPFEIVKVGLELHRDVLYERINQRVDKMMEEGLLDEVKGLYAQKQLKNLQTVGYSELFDYIDGSYSLEEAVSKIKQNTRNYAKRQMTWFRKDKEMNWIKADEEGVVEMILQLK